MPPHVVKYLVRLSLANTRQRFNGFDDFTGQTGAACLGTIVLDHFDNGTSLLIPGPMVQGNPLLAQSCDFSWPNSCRPAVYRRIAPRAVIGGPVLIAPRCQVQAGPRAKYGALAGHIHIGPNAKACTLFRSGHHRVTPGSEPHALLGAGVVAWGGIRLFEGARTGVRQ